MYETGGVELEYTRIYVTLVTLGNQELFDVVIHSQ